MRFFFFLVAFGSARAHPDSGLDIIQFTQKYGYPLESHDVQTEDGYVLTLHRLHTKSHKPPIFFMHGLLSSSIDWVNLGPKKSLGLLLADEDYDVWLGNQRGNTWGREHVKLNPDKDPKQFFNFSFHEIGVYDLTASIDYILNFTKFEQLVYVGHSQGTTDFFVMAAERPEYNKKIQLMVALAPVAYMENLPNPFVAPLMDMYDLFNTFVEVVQMYEILPHYQSITELGKVICNKDYPYSETCVLLLNSIAGFDWQIDAEFISVITSNAPAGCSLKQIQHFAQGILSGNFAQFDYGSKNQEKYGQLAPPLYNLSKITAPVSLYYAYNDWLSGVEDVLRLAKELPNVKTCKQVPSKQFNHLDFLWAQNAPTVLYKDVISEIKNLTAYFVDLILTRFACKIITLLAMFTTLSLPICCLILAIILCEFFNQLQPKHPLAGLQIGELVERYGFEIETHQIVTQDGYILSLHRIPSRRNQTLRPVLLMHGFAQSAQNFVNLGPNNSLGLLLAERGFDVWLGNVRGTTNSRKHQILDAGKDRAFWDFGLDEIALFDLPAFINHILNATACEKLQYVGYSQGTIVFFMLMAEKPHFQTKIQLMTALAPSLFIAEPQSPVVQLAVRFLAVLEFYFEFFNYYDLIAQDSYISLYLRLICNENSLFVELCLQHIFLLHGYNYEEVNKTDLSLIFSTTPAGASPRQFLHIGQLMASGNLQKYDFGERKNWKVYGSPNPPLYDASKICTPIALYYSQNDWSVNTKNIARVIETVQNPIKAYQVPLRAFNHNDFINAKNIVHLLYNEVIEEMLKF